MQHSKIRPCSKELLFRVIEGKKMQYPSLSLIVIEINQSLNSISIGLDLILILDDSKFAITNKGSLNRQILNQIQGVRRNGLLYHLLMLVIFIMEDRLQQQISQRTHHNLEKCLVEGFQSKKLGKGKRMKEKTKKAQS